MASGGIAVDVSDTGNSASQASGQATSNAGGIYFGEQGNPNLGILSGGKSSWPLVALVLVLGALLLVGRKLMRA